MRDYEARRRFFPLVVATAMRRQPDAGTRHTGCDAPPTAAAPPSQQSLVPDVRKLNPEIAKAAYVLIVYMSGNAANEADIYARSVTYYRMFGNLLPYFKGREWGSSTMHR